MLMTHMSRSSVPPCGRVKKLQCAKFRMDAPRRVRSHKLKQIRPGTGLASIVVRRNFIQAWLLFSQMIDKPRVSARKHLWRPLRRFVKICPQAGPNSWLPPSRVLGSCRSPPFFIPPIRSVGLPVRPVVGLRRISEAKRRERLKPLQMAQQSFGKCGPRKPLPLSHVLQRRAFNRPIREGLPHSKST